MSPNSAYFGLLFFLAIVRKTKDSSVKGINCRWACEIVNAHPWRTLETVLSNTSLLKAKFLLNKRVEQECARFTNEANTSESIKVWIYTRQEASIPGSNDFSLLTLAILSNPPSFPFLLERNYWEQDGNISCVFRQTSGQTSNESNGTAKGLEALYSPYFYITKEASNFSKNIKPFLSYIWSENIFTVSAAFTERDETAKNTSAENIQLFQRFEGWHLTVVSVARHLLWITCTLYSTYFLTRFLPNISTVEISEIPVDPQDQAGNDGRSLGQVQQAPQPTEPDYFGKDCLDKSTVYSGSLYDFDDYSDVDLHEQYSSYDLETSNTSLIETEGSGGLNTKRNAGHTVEPYGLQHSILQMHSNPESIESSDGINNSVCVIHFGEGPSQVGLRSFVATKLLRYWPINLAFLLSAPVFVFLLVDIAFVLLPGLVLKVDTPSLPSASMTKSVLFVYEYPYLLMLVFFYCFRISALCVFQSLENINCVPCFSCRKHLLCFIGRNYITQFIPFNCLQFTVCDECKKVDCFKQYEFHIFSNIKYHVDSQLDIPKKNWNDVEDAFHRMFPSFCQCRLCSHSSDNGKQCWSLKTFIIYVVFFIPFLMLCVLDFGLSSPIISFCYGRVWFSSQWFEGKRSKQFWCLFFEFIIISVSIVSVIHLSVCCSKALVDAVISLLVVCVNYPLETIGTYTAITLFWLILWDQYCAFTERYAKLDLILFTICTENHSMKLKYQKGDGHTYFPKDLVDSVRRKVMPLSESVSKLILALSISVGVLIFILLVSTSTKVPNSKLLPVLSSLLLVIRMLHQCYSNFREKKKELMDAAIKETVKHHVVAYFAGKLD